MPYGELEIKVDNPYDIKPVGPDQAQAPVIDIRQQFGSVAFDAKGREIQIQQPQVQAQQPDPWANTGQDKKPLMDGIEAADNNFKTTNMSMQAGAGYALNKACEMGSELFAGIGDLLNSNKPEQPAIEPDAAPQMAANRHFVMSAPQPGGGLFS